MAFVLLSLASVLLPLQVLFPPLWRITCRALVSTGGMRGLQRAGSYDEYVIRAGYSANASIVSERKVDVIAISEALLQYDSKTKKPFVEIETSNQKFKRQDVKLGISDGVNAELISGVSKTDKIKVWNKTEPDKRGEVEDNGWN